MDPYNDRTANFLKYLDFVQVFPEDTEVIEGYETHLDAWLLYAHHDPRDYVELEVITDEDYAISRDH